MTWRFRKYIIIAYTVISISSCSTTEIAPPLPPNPPAYMNVPHPVGMNLADLSALFFDPSAPKDKNALKDCDSDFKKLKARTESAAEVKEGVRELVAQDPVGYHWCFYTKLQELENYVKGDAFLDEKQKEVLSTYEFLVPVARSFEKDYHDSRYIRWAMARYQHLSEWVFYRKLELTPAGTLELVQATKPAGLYKNLAMDSSILNKYNLVPSGVHTADPQIGLPVALITTGSENSPAASPAASPSASPLPQSSPLVEVSPSAVPLTAEVPPALTAPVSSH